MADMPLVVQKGVQIGESRPIEGINVMKARGIVTGQSILTLIK
jgi:hypothetical protein